MYLETKYSEYQCIDVSVSLLSEKCLCGCDFWLMMPIPKFKKNSVPICATPAIIMLIYASV